MQSYRMASEYSGEIVWTSFIVLLHLFLKQKRKEQPENIFFYVPQMKKVMQIWNDMSE